MAGANATKYKEVRYLSYGAKFTKLGDERIFMFIKHESDAPYVWVSWWADGIRHTGEMHDSTKVCQTGD